MIASGTLPEALYPWTSQPVIDVGQKPHRIAHWEGNPSAISKKEDENRLTFKEKLTMCHPFSLLAVR